MSNEADARPLGEVALAQGERVVGELRSVLEAATRMMRTLQAAQASAGEAAVAAGWVEELEK